MNKNSYVPINSEQLEKEMVAIVECWKTFLEKITAYYHDNNNKRFSVSYTVNTLALREIVERVYQRKDYFCRYHSGMLMSEFKEIGLNMFWISKFKPFCISGDGYEEELAFNINDDFALFFMLTALENLAKKMKLEYSSERLSGKLYNEILYSLCFRDLSKEALGIIVELVAHLVITELPVESC